MRLASKICALIAAVRSARSAGSSAPEAPSESSSTCAQRLFLIVSPSPMWDFCRLTWWALVGLFRSRRALEAENLVLRQQINVLRRTAPKRLLLSSIDRLILVGLFRLFPDVRGALAIVNPDNAGFRAYWRWKSR